MEAPFTIYAQTNYPAEKTEVAFVPIGSSGIPGPLNTSVVKALGFENKDFPSEKALLPGHFILERPDYDSIIFIVTISKDSTKNNLKNNLASALRAYKRDIAGKFIWIPLMGTGAGGLDYLDSFNISLDCIKNIPPSYYPNQVMFALPDDIGRKDEFLIQKSTEEWNNEQPATENSENLTESLQGLRVNSITQQKRSFFVGGFDWDGKKLDKRFFEERIWQNGWETKFQKVVDSVQIGDIIFLKSTTRKTDGGFLRLHAVGLVYENQKGDMLLKVNWFPFDNVIELKKGAHLRNAIQKIGPNYVDDILLAVSAQYPYLLNIIEDLSSNQEPENSNILDIIQIKINQQKNFWWLNDIGHDWSEDKVVDTTITYRFSFRDALNPHVGDLFIVSVEPIFDDKLIGVFEIIKIGDSRIEARFVHEFGKKIIIDDLKKNKLIGQWLTPDILEKDISEIPSNIFIEILGTVEQTDLENNVNENSTNPSKIAQQIADLDKGEDYLGIDKDVTAFAKVIASNSFSPPLAIALFGQWGTGKSFFMNKLKDRIKRLSDTGRDEYRSGIAQIHFNAWSYLDANLWASIVTRIFEGLNEYIGNDTLATENKKKIEKELKEQLNVLKEEREFIELQKKLNKEKIGDLELEESTAQQDLTDKINSIKEASLKDILKKVNDTFKVEEKIQSALTANPSIKQSIEGVKTIVPEQYWKDPELALKEAKSFKVFIHEFFNKKNIGWKIFGLTMLLVSIAIIPRLLYEITPWLKDKSIVLPQITLSALAFFTPLWKRFKTVYDKIQPIIGVFWSVKQQHEKSIESAIFSHHQLMESVKIEIEQRKSDVQRLNSQIVELKTEIEELDYKLENTLSTQALYSFIEQRAKGDVYKKHLGIISTIRSDFEVLSELFDSSNKEEKNEEFRKLFNKPLERIVLYIDDLDRCPEDQVVEVLEAVNLLMAFPLFVVVVGVDPRWIKNALIKKYELQFGERRDANGYERIDASNYLEKIFQVPFHLEQASDDAVKVMLKKLSAVNVKEEAQENQSSETEETDTGQSATDTTTSGKSISDQKKEPKPKKKNETSIDEHLALKARELELIPDMSQILGTNPRAIKRFVNVYHILRAHETLEINHNSDEDYLVLMFLLALPMGSYRQLYKSLIEYISKPENQKTQLDKFLMDNMNNDEVGNTERIRLEAHMKELESLQKLRNIPISTFAARNVFIQRFTFSELT